GRAYVDGARETAAGYAVGDQWLAEIPVQLHKVGVPVVYDNSPAVFPDGYPMTDCALYYGWRTEKAAGPFAQPEFRFSPGAIAVHIHSFSAMTLRDPNANRSEEHTSELQSHLNLVCRLLLEKKNQLIDQ